MLVSGMLFSLTLIAFSLSPFFVLGMVFLVIAGITSTVFITVISTLSNYRSQRNARTCYESIYRYFDRLAVTWSIGQWALAEWLGGVEGAPHAVLLGAVTLMVILISVTSLFWRRNWSEK